MSYAYEPFTKFLQNGLPDTPMAAYITRHFKLLRVTAPRLDSAIVILDLYKAGAYPSTYYTAATFEEL